MARYLNTNGVFNPISYQDRIAPLAEYTKQYNELQDKMGEIQVLGDTIGGLINPTNPNDIALLNRYNEFNKQIGALADNMINNGNLADAKKTILGLQGYYANQLAPIERGYNSWQESIKAYDKARMSDPTFIGIDPRSYGISNYMDGNSPQDWSTSGKALTTQAASDAKALSSRIYSVGNRGGYRVQITGLPEESANRVLTAAQMMQRGAKEEDLNQLNLNNTEKNAVEQVIRSYNQISSEYNLDKLKDPANSLAASNAIWDGIYQGLSAGYSEKAIPVTVINNGTGRKGGNNITTTNELHSKDFALPKQNIFGKKLSRQLNKFFDNSGNFRDKTFDMEFYNFDGKETLLSQKYGLSYTLRKSLKDEYGYSDSDIDNMSKEEIKSILLDAYNESKKDAIEGNMSYFTIKPEDFDFAQTAALGIVNRFDKDGNYSISKFEKGDKFSINKENIKKSEFLVDMNSFNNDTKTPQVMLHVDFIDDKGREQREVYSMDPMQLGGDELTKELQVIWAVYEQAKKDYMDGKIDEDLLSYQFNKSNSEAYNAIMRAYELNGTRNDNTASNNK